jgi:hypothetical protein
MKLVDGAFEDFDDREVYEWVHLRAFDPQSRNFAVEFDPDEAKIAFNLRAGYITGSSRRIQFERSVRWMWVYASGFSEYH